MVMQRPAEDTWVDQGKDGETKTMKTEQTWSAFYHVAADADSKDVCGSVGLAACW
jgi:hypothetical protein